jgi:hypothetical protein
MSNEMKAVLMIAEHPAMKDILMPAIDIDRDEIRWDRIDMPGLSGGQRTALSWAYAIWTGSQIDPSTGMRDPFDGFRSMDRSLQVSVIGALAVRA